jgi:hypothetical protein
MRLCVNILADLSASKADTIKADASKAYPSACKADADHEKHKPTASNSFIAIANMIS